MKRLLASILAVSLFCPSAHAQDVEDVRHPIDWKRMDVGVFDIHFPGDQYLSRAREVGQWLQLAQAQLNTSLDHTLDGPVNVILYRNRLEAGQGGFSFENPGGLFPIRTEPRVRRIIVPFDASSRSLQRTLEYQLADIYRQQLHYGTGSVEAAILDIKNDLYAEWVLQAIALSASLPMDPLEEMLARDAILDRELPRLSRLHSNESLNPHTKMQFFAECMLFAGWIEQGTPGGSIRRLAHVFDSNFPFPTARLIKRACEMSYSDVEEAFERAMELKYASWREREETTAFARQLRSPDRHYRFCELAPAPSPDGRFVAFIADDERAYNLVILELETGKESRPLLLEVNIDAVKPSQRGLDWSPDGKQIALVGSRIGVPRLYFKRLGSPELTEHYFPFDDIAQPQWSPDGQSLVMTSLEKGYGDLVLVTASTGAFRRLTDTPEGEFDPAWSPDGKKIAFTKEVEGQLDIFTLDPETGEETRITTTAASESCPTWRPDGAAIAFCADAGGAPNLYIMTLADGAVTRMTDVPGGALAPRWSHDGGTIVFTAYRHGRFTTWSSPPRTAPAPVALDDPDRAAAAKHFTSGLAEDYKLKPYESKLRFESILPTGARISDLLGHHKIDTDTEYGLRSGGFDLGFEVTYTNRVLRPDLFVTIGAFVEKDSSKSEGRGKFEAGGSYPLDRFTSFSIAYFAEHINRRDARSSSDDSDDPDDRRTEFRSGVRVGLGRSTVVRRNSNAVAGYAVGGEVKWLPEYLKTDVVRTTYSLNARGYLEVYDDHVLAARVGAVHSTGPDPERLSLKGRVRGYDSGDPRGTDVAFINVEYRFPIKRDVDWVLPAQVLLLKDIRGAVFVDAGVIGEEGNLGTLLRDPIRDEWHASVGFALRLDTYILEGKYLPVILTLIRVVDHTTEAPKGLKFELTFDTDF